MSTAVAERMEPQVPAIASESAAILSLIERMAVNPDIDPERVERFIELRRQMARDDEITHKYHDWPEAVTIGDQDYYRTEKGLVAA